MFNAIEQYKDTLLLVCKGSVLVQFLSVGINKNDKEIINYIQNKLKKTKYCAHNLLVDKKSCNGELSIVFSLDKKRDVSNYSEEKECQQNEYFLEAVSWVLADYIVKKYEAKLIYRVLNTNYCYFSNNEKKEIYNKVNKLLKIEDKKSMSDLFRIKSRNAITNKLIEYFSSSNSIILDGFVNFRLKDYVTDLENKVEEAVNDFLAEREYNEFIKLLRYFVDIQEPKYSLIHVLPVNDGQYTIFDESNREITKECIGELVEDMHEYEVNHDDILISSLITLAPLRIIIHRIEKFTNAELLTTVKSVFWGRVFLCNKCDLCDYNYSE